MAQYSLIHVLLYSSYFYSEHRFDLGHITQQCKALEVQ